MQDNKWEAFADSFEGRNEYVVGVATIEAIKQALGDLEATGDVLELGCGNGTYTACLLGNAQSVRATDISAGMVETTRVRFEGNDKVLAEVADCASLPYAPGSFDTVVMVNLFHIIPCRAEALSEARRVLRPGGWLIIVSITQHGMEPPSLTALAHRYSKTYGAKPPHAITLTPEVVERYVAQAGLRDLTCRLLGGEVKALYADARVGEEDKSA